VRVSRLDWADGHSFSKDSPSIQLSFCEMENLSKHRANLHIATTLARKYGSFRSLFGTRYSEHDDPVSQPGPDILISSDNCCSTCKDIDWKSVLDANSSSSVQKVLQIDLLNPSNCAICKFFLQSLGPFTKLTRHDLIAIPVGPTFTPLLNTIDAPLLGIVPKLDSAPRSVFEIQSNIIFEVSRKTVRTLQPIQPMVDLSAVSSWLRVCLHWHTKGCGPSLIDADSLKVIDCLTRNIIAYPKDAAYVTLSYVWGRRAAEPSEYQPTQQNLDRGRLPHDLPQTINDALEVTIKLGYRYLWIDKYCVNPDEATFHTQLLQMNLVYRNSVVTIIAAAGNDSSYGLPGISSPRKVSSQLRIGQRTLSSVPISIGKEIAGQVWSSRGWTYQEGLLSTRRLIFTDRQVYFECQGYYRFEGIIFSPKTLSRLHSPDRAGFSRALHGKINDGNMTQAYKLGLFPIDRIGSREFEIWHRIREYSKRSLTYEGDILNAMLGLFRLFEEHFSVQHVWGIPFSTSDASRPIHTSGWWVRNVAFLEHLGWNIGAPATRRKSFPSWSWAGWHGTVLWQYADKLEKWGCDKYTVTNKDFSLQLEKTDGSLVPWSSCERYNQKDTPSESRCESFVDEELSRFLRLFVRVSRILPPATGTANYDYGLDLRILELKIQLLGCSPSTNRLWALHMPYDAGWMLVIEQHGDHWERVGTATFAENQHQPSIGRNLVNSIETARVAQNQHWFSIGTTYAKTEGIEIRLG
jgi:hypothetical protein